MADPCIPVWIAPQGLPVYSAFIRRFATDSARADLARAEARGASFRAFARVFVRGGFWVAEFYFNKPVAGNIALIVQLGDVDWEAA